MASPEKQPSLNEKDLKAWILVIIAIALTYIATRLTQPQDTLLSAEGVPEMHVNNLLENQIFWAPEGSKFAYLCSFWKEARQWCIFYPYDNKLYVSPKGQKIDFGVAPAWSPDGSLFSYRCDSDDPKEPGDSVKFCVTTPDFNFVVFGPRVLHPEFFPTVTSVPAATATPTAMSHAQ